MDIYAQIKDSIKEIVGKTKLVLSIAKVVSVDGDVCTCELDGLQVSDVRLRAVLNGKSERILITPKKDSYVLVYDMSIGLMRDFVVVSYSEIEKVNIEIGETSIEVKDGKICINGGENDGLVKIAELTNKLNELVNAFNNHTHSGVITEVSGGSGAPAVGTPGNTGAPVSTAKTFTKDDYEDTKVTH